MPYSTIMIYINITNFELITQLGKYNSMIKRRRLKTVVISFQAVLSFVLSRKDINIYNDIARRHGSVTNKYF